MFDWFSGEKRRAKEIREKAERDARLRAELAVKARQFDAENRHQFPSVTELTDTRDSLPDAKVLLAQEAKQKPASTTTILNYSARTSFNF